MSASTPLGGIASEAGRNVQTISAKQSKVTGKETTSLSNQLEGLERKAEGFLKPGTQTSSKISTFSTLAKQIEGSRAGTTRELPFTEEEAVLRQASEINTRINQLVSEDKARKVQPKFRFERPADISAGITEERLKAASKASRRGGQAGSAGILGGSSGSSLLGG